MEKFHNSKDLSIHQQDRKIKNKLPQFINKGNYKQGIWIGDLQPTKWSSKYKVKITYKLKKYPEVNIISPNIFLAKGKNQLPHVYPKNKLCLFFPEKKEWTSTKFIADTIIPWTSLWLFYYEDWLYTGKWKGGGIHPNKKQKAKKKERIKI